MYMIASYANKKNPDMISPKPLLTLIALSVLALSPPFILISFVEMNKLIALSVCLGFFLADYYVLCWISRLHIEIL